MELSEVVEVVEARLKVGNEYHSRGYKLLSIQGVSGTGTHPGGKTHYVIRQVVYVLGRLADVELYRPDHQQVKVPASTRDQANLQPGGSRFKGLNVKDLTQAGCLFAQGRGPVGKRALW